MKIKILEKKEDQFTEHTYTVKRIIETLEGITLYPDWTELDLKLGYGENNNPIFLKKDTYFILSELRYFKVK